MGFNNEVFSLFSTTSVGVMVSGFSVPSVFISQCVCIFRHQYLGTLNITYYKNSSAYVMQLHLKLIINTSKQPIN